MCSIFTLLISAKIFHGKSCLEPALLEAARGVNFFKKNNFEWIISHGKFRVIGAFLKWTIAKKTTFFKYSSIYAIINKKMWG